MSDALDRLGARMTPKTPPSPRKQKLDRPRTQDGGSNR